MAPPPPMLQRPRLPSLSAVRRYPNLLPGEGQAGWGWDFHPRPVVMSFPFPRVSGDHMGSLDFHPHVATKGTSLSPWWYVGEHMLENQNFPHQPNVTQSYHSGVSGGHMWAIIKYPCPSQPGWYQKGLVKKWEFYPNPTAMRSSFPHCVPTEA